MLPISESIAPDVTVADLGERALVARIRARIPPPPSSVVVGIGDDAAVVAPDRGTLTVITTDALVDGIHFDRTFASAADIGHKALAVNLSDLAAMGAAPRHALLSLALPPHSPVADIDALVDALLVLAGQHGTALVGGNIAGSTGPISIDVTVTGSVRRRRVLTRGGARPGDFVYVSGQIGGAAAGLASLRGADGGPAPATDRCRRRFLRPEPRVRLGLALGRNRAARACIDLSDGLADALHQVTDASGVGARIDADRIPIDPEARDWFTRSGADPVLAALTGGEDYELAFAAPPAFRGRLAHVRRLIGDLVLTPIGVITKERDVVLARGGTVEPLPGSFEHFRSTEG